MPISTRVQSRRRSRRGASILQTAPKARLCRRLCEVLAAVAGWCVPAIAQQRALGNDIELLGLAAAKSSAALPPGWTTRPVRGQRLPLSQIIDSSGIRYMRFSGAGHAGWFVRELRVPLLASAGRLQWTWRALLAPQGADVAAAATDDASLRVFVVFGRHARFAWKPRVLFYSLADGVVMPDRTDAPFGVRIAGRPAMARNWVQASADPFSDYRSIWGAAPPPVIAIGVMQDTDQTRSPAVGDLLNLYWRRGDAPDP